MAVDSGTTFQKVWALTAAVCLDFLLFYASGFVVTHGAFGHLLRLWATAAVRWSALAGVCLLTLGGMTGRVLLRFVTSYSLLPAVFGTGAAALYSHAGDCGAAADVRGWLVCAGASVAAALFWELTIPDTDEPQEKKQEAKALFMRVLHLYKPDYLLLLGGLLFLSLAVICEMFIPFYTGRVVDILRDFQPNEFLSALLFMSLFSLGSSVCAGCRGGLLLCAIGSFTFRIKVKLFGALTKQEMAFFEATRTGELTSRLSKDTNLMGRTVCLHINVLLRTLVKTLGMITLMLNLSWKLTFLVLMETPVTGLMQTIYDTHYQRLTREMQDAMAQASEAANEVVFGVRVVRSFNAEEHEARRYRKRLMDIRSLRVRRDTIRIIYLLIRRMLGLGMQVLMLYYGRLFIQSGEMTTGNLVSFILYQSDLGHNIRTLTYIFGDMLNSVGAAGKVFEYIDRKPKVSTEGKLKPDHLTGHVSIRDVNFTYPSKPQQKVLQDFCLELKPGQMTALVGPSGEGKSTCVSLLERLYEIGDGNGEILLDNKPLKDYDHRYFHRKIAVVSQEPVLFSGTIRDNIAYGLTDCPLDQIQEAARKANAHDFIRQREKGYDTEVGEGGLHLSKSERQQIAIARALVRQPQVLILDEITSALDTESELKVLQALTSCPNQTLLVIAHKLQTIEKADQIVVIRGGKVEERGTHDELMALRGSYYRLRDERFAEESCEQ